MRSLVITGTSTGIGRATALRMDELGWRVFAGVRREEDAESMRAAGSDRLTPLILDITDPAAVEAAAGKVAAELGETGLDGLVNNAGATDPGPLELMPLEDFRRLLEVNVLGQVAVTQAFMPLIRRATGRIVFVGSASGRGAPPMLAAYSASKAGLAAVADGFRRELRQWRIPVSLVEPGMIDTPIWDHGESRLGALEESSPEYLDGAYGPMMTAFRALGDKMAEHKLPPEAVTKVIERALCSRRPRSRYLVGREARSQALAFWLLPDRVLDWLVARMMTKA